MFDFYKEYILLNLKDYSNINIDFPIAIFILCISLGVVLGIVLISYIRASMCLIIKRLTRYEAFDEGRAKTLDELKINSFGVRALLAKSSPLTKIVTRVGEKKYTYEEYTALTKTKGFEEERVNFAEAKFYICPEAEPRAKAISDSNPPTLLSTVLISLFIISISVCLILLLPGILSLINNSL